MIAILEASLTVQILAKMSETCEMRCAESVNSKKWFEEMTNDAWMMPLVQLSKRRCGN
jgi:hypothetical protein